MKATRELALSKVAKDGAIVHGGDFRIDKGPTALEKHTFRLAAGLHRECLSEGIRTTLGCVLNDLALAPDKRPKATGTIELPESYVRILHENDFQPAYVRLFYESTLRNQARRDGVSSLKINSSNGVPVAVCASIMGRFYYQLALDGYTQQLGFYAREQKPKLEPGERPDNSCSVGAIKGAIKEHSGYELRLEVLNFWVSESPFDILPIVHRACDLEPNE